MKSTILTWFVLILVCVHYQSVGQTFNGMEASYGAGKILKIFRHFPERTIHQAATISLGWQNESIYAASYKKHQNQVTLSFHDFGNKTILGQGVGLQYRLRLFKSYQRFHLFSTYGFGGIYTTRPFHYLDNPENVVIGSKIAALINLELGGFFDLNQRIRLGLMASAWHVSNMHTVLPNVGLNSPMLTASLAYSFQTKTLNQKPQDYAPLKGWEYNLRALYGRNEAGTTARPVNGPKYAKYIGVLGISYRFRTIHRISVDVEGYYDAAYRLHNEIGPYEFEHPILRSSALMLMFGHEFIHGNFGLVTHVGINLYNPTLDYLQREVNGDGHVGLSRYIPIRVAARYYVFKPEKQALAPYVQFGVKSNFGGADYLELGIGILISKR